MPRVSPAVDQSPVRRLFLISLAAKFFDYALITIAVAVSLQRSEYFSVYSGGPEPYLFLYIAILAAAQIAMIMRVKLTIGEWWIGHESSLYADDAFGDRRIAQRLRRLALYPRACWLEPVRPLGCSA